MSPSTPPSAALPGAVASPQAQAGLEDFDNAPPVAAPPSADAVAAPGAVLSADAVPGSVLAGDDAFPGAVLDEVPGAVRAEEESADAVPGAVPAEDGSA